MPTECGTTFIWFLSFLFQAEDGIRDYKVTGVQTCALPICRRRGRRMSAELVHARVVDHLKRLRLGTLADRLDATLGEAARVQPTYIDFLDQLLRDEMAAKQRRRIEMGIQIAHFPSVKTLEDFDFKFQPSIDAKLVRELATGRFIASAENALFFGPPESAT